MKELRILLICALALAAPINVFAQEKTEPPKISVYGNRLIDELWHVIFYDSTFDENPGLKQKREFKVSALTIYGGHRKDMTVSLPDSIPWGDPGFSWRWANKALQGQGTLTLPEDGQVWVEVMFNPPMAAGVYEKVLTISSNAENAADGRVKLLAEVFQRPVPNISLSTTSIDFGDVQVGTEARRTFTITNSSQANVASGPWCRDQTQEFCWDFRQTAQQGEIMVQGEPALAPGGSYTYEVVFFPAVPGDKWMVMPVTYRNVERYYSQKEIVVFVKGRGVAAQPTGGPQTEIVVNAGADGYEPDSHAFAVDFEPSQILIGGTVYGTDGKQTTALANATVELELAGQHETVTTDADGKYTLDVQTQGTKSFTQTWAFVLHKKVEAQIAATARPGQFFQRGEEAKITVKVTDSAGQPLPQEKVKLVRKQPQGPTLTATTDGQGTAMFTVSHDQAQAQQYLFIAKALHKEKQVVIPVAGDLIRVESNPRTDKPFIGVVADGISNLTITIDAPNELQSVSIQPPALGTLQRAGQTIGAAHQVDLTTTHQFNLNYHPPDYLTGQQLNVSQTLSSSAPAAPADTRVWTTTDSVTFAFKHADGQQLQIPLEIQVYRPPVFLAHGFEGGRGTWWKLNDTLRNQKFDTVSDTLYVFDQSIEAQATVLKLAITGRKILYGDNGIKLHRMDVVAHSMGGLITRHYISYSGLNENDIRKLIMVGTPNHGVGRLKKWGGDVYAYFQQKHEKAASQLWEQSTFLKQLNSGEKTGQHLSRNVEYGNIYGYPSDWVVDASSASLNGVYDHLLFDVSHSPALAEWMGAPITEHPEVFDMVYKWLTHKIPSATLKDMRMQVRAGTSGVVIRSWDVQGNKTDKPVPPNTPGELFRTWEGLITGPNARAQLWFTLDGKPWGKIDLDSNSHLVVLHTTWRITDVEIRRGSARLTTKPEQGGHYKVALTSSSTGVSSGKYRITPKAVVVTKDTDFMVDAGSDIKVWCLAGKLEVQGWQASGDIDRQPLNTGQAVAVGGDGTAQAITAAVPTWCQQEFYQPATTVADTGSAAGNSASTGGQATGMGPGSTTAGTQPSAGSASLPQPMPLAANSVVKEAVLCQGVDEKNNPEGIANTFPADTVKIGLYLRITNAPANTEITLEWSRGERLLQRRLLLVSGSKRLITYIYAARAEHLRAGSYAVEIKENDRLVARLPFTIQPE